MRVIKLVYQPDQTKILEYSIGDIIYYSGRPPDIIIVEDASLDGFDILQNQVVWC
jgi:hypothetical protein